MDDKQSVLLLSGYNPRAVIAFCRWATQRRVRFHLLASGKTDPILLTNYVDNVEIVRESNALRIGDFLSWVEIITKRYGYQRVLILPTTEYFNRFLLKNRGVLENAGCIIPLVDESLYVEISDKLKFANLCKSHNITIPGEYKILPEGPPFVAKPVAYFSREGKPLYPYLVINASDYELFINSEHTEDYFFQEYVMGENHYLLAYISRDGSHVLFSQENLIQQSCGKSVILARSSKYHHSKDATKYIEMLRKVGFWGLVMIEVRQTEPGKFVMIEANPRLWGPLQFVVDNKIDLFGTLLRDNGMEVEEDPGNGGYTEFYYWSGGITPDSQPLAFHNFSDKEFTKNIQDIRKHDIFLREDTMEIYLQELSISGKAYGQ